MTRTDELLRRVDAALAERTSFEPWGVQDVAAAAGMGPGGHIRRFGSKEGLLHALTQRWIETLPVATSETGDAHAELQAYVEASFATPSSVAAIFAFGVALEPSSPTHTLDHLLEGWT